MSQPIFHSLTQALSPSRLGVYIAHANPRTSLEATSLYFHNLKLSASLYPSIHLFEITLRNNINEALKNATGNPDWYDNPSLLQGAQNNQLKEAKDKILTTGKPLSPDQIVSELSMGFWVGLFNKGYEQPLWRHYNLIKDVVPRAPKYQRTRDEISKRVNKIRLLRNRVFHHEPIWVQPDLPQVYITICETLKWLNPDMIDLLKPICQFNNVRNNGIEELRINIFQNHYSFDGICLV